MARRSLLSLLAALGCLCLAGAAQRPRQETPEDSLRNPNPGLRLEAARRLGRLGNSRAVDALRAALETEKDRRVVDAIIAALENLKAPVNDPQACRELLGRCWDASSAGRLFECWRSSAGREEVYRASMSGPAVLRSLSIRALVREPGLDGAKRENLLHSLTEVLSRDEEMAPSTGQMLKEGLWALSGKDMRTALVHADRISRSDARLAASVYLSQQDLAGYLAGRRLRQFLIGVALAAGFAVFMIWRKARRAAALLAASAGGWALWTWVSKDARQLPPAELALLTTSCIAFLSAGAVNIPVGWVSWEKVSSTFMRGLGRIGLAGSGAGILAALVTLWSRNAGLFPVLDRGWDLMVEPFAALNLGILTGGAIALLESLLQRRLPAVDLSQEESDPLAGLD